MKALRLERWRSDPVLVDVARPEPAPGEVLVHVGGAGVCHSDLHLVRDVDDGLAPWGPPFTLGHENAGWVAALGAGTDGPDLGTPVAVYGSWGCGRCGRCRVGIETSCEDPQHAPVPWGGGGLGADGGMAEYMLVPSPRLLVPLPDGLDPVTAAPLTDAALTPYHAIRRSWPLLVPGSTAVVIGIGGLGHLAVQILRATTAARVIAVDTREEARELATWAGAELVMPPDPSAAAAIRASTGGRGAEVVLDCVGDDRTLGLAAAVGRPLGDLVVLGLGGGVLGLGFFTVPYELSVRTSYGGTCPELVEVLDLAARGRISPAVTTVGLDEAADAYRRLGKGEIVGRVVVLPD